MWEEGYVCKRTGVLGGQKRLPDPPPPQFGDAHSGGFPYGCWELNPVSLQAQCVSSSLSFNFYFNLYCWY